MAAQGEVRAHLEACSDCAHVDAVEQELTSALEPRLPQRPASLALKRRIKGGAVGYFLDRKAAVLVYAHGLHTISLFIVRGGDLHWSSQDGSAFTTEERGFNVVMWRQGSLSSQHSRHSCSPYPEAEAPTRPRLKSAVAIAESPLRGVGNGCTYRAVIDDGSGSRR